MSQMLEKLTFGQDLIECRICGRRFTTERIKAHEPICQKSAAVTKRCFDVTQQRIKGMETKKLPRGLAQNECSNKAQQNRSCGLSTNWRDKHEDVLRRIKNAKELANGRSQKQSDLPMPPPKNFDADKEFIQCQHCSKIVNHVSALRHVAACTNRLCKPKSKIEFPGPSMTSTSNNTIQK